jgi:hypothetical protein
LERIDEDGDFCAECGRVEELQSANEDLEKEIRIAHKKLEALEAKAKAQDPVTP